MINKDKEKTMVDKNSENSIDDIYADLGKVLQSHKKLQNDMVIMGRFFKDEIAQLKKIIVEGNNLNNKTDESIINLAENLSNLETKVNQIMESGISVSSCGLDELFLRYVRDELSERENKIVQSVEEFLSKELVKIKGK
jgi:hypothetical protein